MLHLILNTLAYLILIALGVVYWVLVYDVRPAVKIKRYWLYNILAFIAIVWAIMYV